MILKRKHEILDYLKSHNDGSEVATKLIRNLEYECYYADCEVYSVGIDDLNDYGDQTTLREKLGKEDGEEYTIEDCERVADALADMIADEYSENLDNAINYEL